MLLIDPKVLEATTTEALRHGWQVCTHAIGDKGNALVLDAYAAARKAVPERTRPPAPDRARPGRPQGGRPPFRRAGHRSPRCSPRTPATTCAGPTPGSGRAGSTAPTPGGGSSTRGVALAYGSDFPVEIVNPFWGIYAAITRQDPEGRPAGGWHPEQRLTLEETLRGFTAGSARAAFAEDRLGILKTGFRADLTVVDRDLFHAKPKEILATKVLMTIVDGEIAFERE